MNHLSKPVLGIGTDIVYLPRIRNLIATHKFLVHDRIPKKFMHEMEISHMKTVYEGLENSVQARRMTNYIAGIWSIKESFLKALNHYVPQDIMPPAQTLYTKAVYKDNNDAGTPRLIIDPEFGKKYPGHREFATIYLDPTKVEILVSVSHDGDYLQTMLCISLTNN